MSFRAKSLSGRRLLGEVSVLAAVSVIGGLSAPGLVGPRFLVAGSSE